MVYSEGDRRSQEMERIAAKDAIKKATINLLHATEQTELITGRPNISILFTSQQQVLIDSRLKHFVNAVYPTRQLDIRHLNIVFYEKPNSPLLRFIDTEMPFICTIDVVPWSFRSRFEQDMFYTKLRGISLPHEERVVSTMTKFSIDSVPLTYETLQ